MSLTRENEDSVILKLCKDIKALDDTNVERLHIPNRTDLNHYSSKTRGWLPVHFAAKMGKEKILCLLIKQGADPYLFLNAIDTETGMIASWKNAFFLIEDENMKKRVREYYFTHIKQYHSIHNVTETICGKLLADVLIRLVAENFLNDLPSFSHFSLTCKFISELLKTPLTVRKKIHDNRKKIQSNLDSIRFFYNNEETEATSAGEAAYTHQHRDELVAQCTRENQQLEEAIHKQEISLSVGMKF